MFAVDAGSTMSVGKAMAKYGLHAKGSFVTPAYTQNKLILNYYSHTFG
jgi:hypothetical protein